MTALSDNNTTIELNEIEVQFVTSLVLKFARSVDVNEKSYQPDAIAYPIMFEIAKGVLSELGITYTSDNSEA